MKRSFSFFFCTLVALPAFAQESSPKNPLEPTPAFQFKRVSIDETFPMGYQIKLADINADGKLDIVALREGEDGLIAWYANPSWESHRITPPTVIRPISMDLRDIDGDGDLDMVLAHDFDFDDSTKKGTVSWLEQGENASDLWTPHLIDHEPMQHRVIWADMDGDGKDELISSPLLGFQATPTDFWHSPVRIKISKVPSDPKLSPWPTTVLYDKLHAIHGMMKFPGRGSLPDSLLMASYEGISLLRLHRETAECIPWHEGHQENEEKRGSSEIARGVIGDEIFYAAIEPRHGNEVVVYRGIADDLLSAKPKRTVIDDQVQVGHGLLCADLNHDGISEILVGDRGDNQSYYLYYVADRQASSWKKMFLDKGTMAGAGCAVADLDGDSDLDIAAVGSSTGNICLYINQLVP